MAIVARKLASGGIVFWISFRWAGKDVWERSGADRRVAERLEKRRKAEVKAGTYAPPHARKATTVGQYGETWIAKRSGRNADSEASFFRRYVLAREWFASMSLEEVRPRHLKQLVDELKATISEATTKPLASKTVANIYGLARTMFRMAHFEEMIAADPCTLPHGTLKRKTGKKRTPYSAAEVLALTTCPDVPPELRMFNALAFYTGMREGEVCGRRWRDYDPLPKPLGSLTVETQYDDQPLKTAETKGDQPRLIPVHPDLAAMLEWWRTTGFELVFARKPLDGDFIVPIRGGKSNQTRSSAYKQWTRGCAKAGVTNRSLHSTRHTFISLARRGGASKDVVEQVTHNASGDIVDAYTTWDWEPLCKAVLCFPHLDSNLDQDAESLEKQVEPPGIEPPGTVQTRPNSRELDGARRIAEVPSISVKTEGTDADPGARQGIGPRAYRTPTLVRLPPAVGRAAFAAATS